MSKKKEVYNVQTGLGIGGISGLTFIALLVIKLAVNPSISWFWVFFPLWIVPSALIALSLVIFIIGAIFYFFSNICIKKPKKKDKDGK